MDKRSKLIIGLFIAVVIALIIAEVVRPKPIKWSTSYTSFDKIPFGCYVLHQEIDKLFPENDIQTVSQNPYVHLSTADTLTNSSYVFINSQLTFDPQEALQIMDYVKRGNTVFIATNTLGGILKDSLELTINTSYQVLEEVLRVKTMNASFADQEFTYKRGINKSYITAFDTINTTVLGYTLADKKKEFVNFIKVQFGEGHFFINTLPQAYANYYMLNGNKTYVSNALSYLTSSTLYWDDTKKDGKLYVDSPMRYVLKNASLKWAYYLLLLFILLFIIFKAKRQQRIIPVIQPLENSSVEFTKTISQLYYQHKNYGDIISKRIRFFLANVRTQYYLNTEHLSTEFAEKLALKSGVSLDKATQLVDTLQKLQQQQQHTEDDVIALDRILAHFKF